MEWLQIVWFFLIVLLLAGYSILDGFDLGVGVLFPYLSRTDGDRRVLFNAIGPFWDGNEVWLITAGGALFAAFPPVYATVFSGFYLALMLVLFALIFRAVSLEFWSHDPRRRVIWNWAFVLGSFLPALLYGVALGNLIQGIPLDIRRDFSGDFFTLLRPFPLACGVLGLAAFALQGGTFTALKSEGDLRERARSAILFAGWVFLVLLLSTLVLGVVAVPDAADRPLIWLFAAGTLILWHLTLRATRRGQDGRAFLLSSFVHIGLWALVATVMFPVLVRALGDPDLSLTVFNASSSRLTLTVMLGIALVGMPLVVGYTIFAYRVFRGKVKPGIN